MATQRAVRALALVGPTGAGKTSLMVAMLTASGSHAVGADKVGDQSPEARLGAIRSNSTSPALISSATATSSSTVPARWS